MRKHNRVAKALVAVVASLVVVLGILWVFGPREPVDLAVRFDAARIGDDPVAYLAQEEAGVPNLRPDTAKEIVWAYPTSRAKTPLAIVYVHGFSASKNEVRPLPDIVARELGANLYFTRLAGHGRDGAAMTEPRVRDWVEDLAEAVAVGRRIGERVVVVGLSTGATLAVLAGNDPSLGEDVAGLVLLSPNFGVRNRWGFVLDLPFARWIGPRLFGPDWGAGTSDPEVAGVWTMRYPTVALLTMGALVRAVRTSRIEAIRLPALFVYSPRDAIVDPERTRAVAARWTAPKEVVEIADSGDPNHHVIAGDLLSPQTTNTVAARIVDWVRRLPPG